MPCIIISSHHHTPKHCLDPSQTWQLGSTEGTETDMLWHGLWGRPHQQSSLQEAPSGKRLHNQLTIIYTSLSSGTCGQIYRYKHNHISHQQMPKYPYNLPWSSKTMLFLSYIWGVSKQVKSRLETQEPLVTYMDVNQEASNFSMHMQLLCRHITLRYL